MIGRHRPSISRGSALHVDAGGLLTPRSSALTRLPRPSRPSGDVGFELPGHSGEDRVGLAPTSRFCIAVASVAADHEAVQREIVDDAGDPSVSSRVAFGAGKRRVEPQEDLAAASRRDRAGALVQADRDPCPTARLLPRAGPPPPGAGYADRSGLQDPRAYGLPQRAFPPVGRRLETSAPGRGEHSDAQPLHLSSSPQSVWEEAFSDVRPSIDDFPFGRRCGRAARMGGGGSSRFSVGRGRASRVARWRGRRRGRRCRW